MTNQELYEIIKDVEYKILNTDNNINKFQNLHIDNFDQVISLQININKHHISLELLNIFDKHSFIFITSGNPFGNKVSIEENQLFNQNLISDLLDYLTLDTVSVFEKNEDESGYIAFDVPLPIAITLLNKYNQNAIVWADKIKTTLLINDL